MVNRAPGRMPAGAARPETARPLGCRVFFCDPSFETVAPELSEIFVARLKDLASRHNWLWNYAPLHQHLRQAQVEGRLKIASADCDNQPEKALIAGRDPWTSTAATAESNGDRTPVLS